MDMLNTIKRIFNKESDEPLAVAKDAVIIDVRSEAEYNAGHISTARLIPLEQIAARIGELPKDKQIVVYCRSGNRSKHAKKILNDLGFNQVVDGGGIDKINTLLAHGVRPAEWAIEQSKIVDNTLHTAGEVMKILIPTDFTEQADFALIMASKLAEKFYTEVHLLHVIEVPDTVTVDSNGQIITCGEIDKHFLSDQRATAQNKISKYKNINIGAITTHVTFGRLSDEILAISNRDNFDLIVMGTKGVFGLKERIAGSNAQYIGRKSRIPVLTLMCDRTDLVIRNILFVHDFDQAEPLHPIVFRIQEVFNTTFHQLHIQPSGEIQRGQELVEKMERYARKHDLSNTQNHILSAVDVETGVQRFLAGQDVDLIFIGTHGKGGRFHESAAENLVKHIFKPIIVFHLP